MLGIKQTLQITGPAIMGPGSIHLGGFCFSYKNNLFLMDSVLMRKADAASR